MRTVIKMVLAIALTFGYMAMANKVSHPVALVAGGVVVFGWLMLIEALPQFFAWYGELISPAVAAGRSFVGSLVCEVGVWVMWVGSRIGGFAVRSIKLTKVEETN